MTTSPRPTRRQLVLAERIAERADLVLTVLEAIHDRRAPLEADLVARARAMFADAGRLLAGSGLAPSTASRRPASLTPGELLVAVLSTRAAVAAFFERFPPRPTMFPRRQPRQ